MSDVLIKGMEMPKKGEYRMTLYVCDDGYAYMDVDLFPVDKDRFEAVPVPPHGRLIDADVLCKILRSLAENEYTPEVFANWLENHIDAIIPADSEEEDE